MGRSGEDGGPLETGAKTCRMFAGASPLLAAGLAVLRCPGLPRAETLRLSVLVRCAATGVRFGRFRWDDRAAILSVIRAPSIASPPDEVDVDGVVSHLLSRSCPLRDGQAPAGLRPTGPSAAMPVTRANAVTPTATAPMTENTNCQVSDGIVCFTMPCVA